jgi:hypothetical protein
LYPETTIFSYLRISGALIKRDNSAGCGKNPTIQSGVQRVNVNGQDREYTIRIPEGYNSNRPYKIIYAFHWVGGTQNDVAGGGSDGELWSFYGQVGLSSLCSIF